MIEFLKENSIEALYHFANTSNLPSIIQEGGLKSKEFLEGKGVLDQIWTGGNDLSKQLDVRWGNWNKVSLSFCPRLPMAYYREQDQHLCYLVIRLNAITSPGVVITDMNAVDNNQRRGSGIDGLRLVDFEAVAAEHPYTERTKKKKQAEILVPDEVSIEEIEKVAFRSKSSLREGLRICQGHPDFCQKFVVDPSLFIRPSAYCLEHRLTQLEITADNVNSLKVAHEDVFTADAKITCLVELKAHAGARDRFEWFRDDEPGSFQQADDRFVRPTTYYTWNSIEADSVGPGDYRVRYLVDGRSELIHQFQQPFKIVTS